MDNKVISGLLNPVRMRILQLLLNNEIVTTRRIAEELPDIPTASLYRHINKLAEDKIIEVVAENKIRGTLEKVYQLKKNPYQELSDTIERGDQKELFNLFYTFSMTMMADFQSYLNQENYNLLEDKVGFRSYPLYLSDGECEEFIEDLRNALIKAGSKEAAKGRKLRKFSFVLMPGNEK